MRPTSKITDLPSTHEITTYIHNAFVKFIDSLKQQLQVFAICTIQIII